MSTTTHPLPHHPPSTHLPVGEVVYMISGILDPNKTLTTYEIYHKMMSPAEILELFIIDATCEAAAKRKSTGQLIKISIHMMGYIESEIKYSEDYTVMQSALLHGYDIRWEARGESQYHSVFEDEESIVPLKDLVILDGQQLLEELHNARKGQR